MESQLFQNNGIYMLHWFQGKSLCESAITSVSAARSRRSQVETTSCILRPYGVGVRSESDIT